MRFLKKFIRSWEKDLFGLRLTHVLIDILISTLIILHLIRLLASQARG